MDVLFTLVTEFPKWAVIYMLPPISIILGLAVFMGIVTAAKLKQDRKRKAPEWVPEYPYIPRHATKEEADAFLAKVKEESK
jgi:hypothetical protein